MIAMKTLPKPLMAIEVMSYSVYVGLGKLVMGLRFVILKNEYVSRKKHTLL